MNRTTMSQNARSIFKTAIVALALLWPSAALAQGTPMPWAIPQFFDASGDPLVSGKLCVFAAGTSTLKDSYTTAALSVANANPVVMNAGGWPASSGSIVGVFLIPGDSYKFVLKQSNATTCVPDTGTTIWSVDNITAVPVESGAIDIDGTAGEALIAGDVVYLSDGGGSRTVGRWYKADADLAYASSDAPFLGMVPTSISSGASGTIRIKGLVTVSGVSASVVYYVSATAGGVTSTAPALIRNVGTGYTATSILLSPANNGKIPALSSSYLYNAIGIASAAQGRCTLTTATPVTTADVTGASATTIFYALYNGNQIGLYSGSVWTSNTIAQLSIAVPATTATMYDVFVDYNDGTPQLAVTAWTNDTTRATALTTQDGWLVKTGDTQQRYVCSFRTTAVSGQTEDSFARRFLWNYYNRVPRAMRVLEATNSWSYNTSTWRCANTVGACVNQLQFVIGVAEVPLEASVHALASASATSAVGVAVGLDSTTVPTAGNVGFGSYAQNAVIGVQMSALKVYPAVGYHFAAWLEIGDNSGNTVTWVGDNGGTVVQTGIHGTIDG